MIPLECPAPVNQLSGGKFSDITILSLFDVLDV
jgi:hypothetical protein